MWLLFRACNNQPKNITTFDPGNSANALEHYPNGPGNSENAPGHNKDGPGNSPNTPGPGQKLKFEYDQAGNLVSILSELFITHYSYDSENHLISATINGNHEAVYTYNALGLRDSKTTQRGTVYYVYDGTTLIAELDEDGEILAYYSHDLDGKLVSATYGDETYFYHFNHRGDTLYLTDQEGNIAASYTYDAWGNIMSKAGDLANKNPYRYKGRHGYYYDADTDLYLLNSRWYNPELKRFMTRDNQQGEATDPVSLNRYVYCGNDPVNYVDPMGTYRVTVSINGGGSPKPTVPEPPKPPQKPTLSSPTPQIAPTSGTKQSSSSTVISQTVKTSQPTESAPQAPAQPTEIQNLIKGTYFGTQYGEENTDWYVQRIVEMEHAAWYELVPYYVGAGFSVLWTPDTWRMTK